MMSKPRKPSAKDLAPLLAEAAQRIDDAITSLTDATTAAAAAEDRTAKAQLHRLILQAMAIAKSARLLAHPGHSHPDQTPQPPNPTAI